MAALHGDREPVIDISPRYTVTDLGILPGFESSRATALNDKGQVIGSLSREDWDFSPIGFLWSEGKMRDLGNVMLTSINNKGQIVGAKRSRFPMFSAAISSSDRFQDLLKNTSAMSIAQSINDCGQVVGHIQSTRRKSPADIKRGCFLWENGRRRYLDIPEGYKAGDAIAINNQGQIVGELWDNGPNEQYAVLNNRHAALWESEKITILDEPPGFSESIAVAINNQGQILGKVMQSNVREVLTEAMQGIEFTLRDDPEVIQKGFADMSARLAAVPSDAWKSRQQSFLWQNGKMEAIEGQATALNDQGQVVGLSGYTLSVEDKEKGREAPYAFLWQNGELFDLNDLLLPESGWRLTKANDINNRGQIVGSGEINGKTRAFLLTPAINR